jgi:hypothetical protein
MEARKKSTHSESPSNGNGYKVDRDPSTNVNALVLSESRRQDDLRGYSERLTEEQVKHATELAEARTDCAKLVSSINVLHVTEMANERVKHANEMADAETKRVDAIRQVDVGQVAAALAAQTLAVQAVESRRVADAENLRNTVVNTAKTVLDQTTVMKEEFSKRFSTIEQTQSEGRGRSSLADPAVDEMKNDIKSLVRVMSEGAGKKEGISATTAALGTGIVALLALIGIGSFVFTSHVGVGAPIVPQYVYLPAPTATTPPPAPPAPTAPR